MCNTAVIAIDSTGIKVTNRGEWIRHKWKVKRGYLKIHIAVDIKRKRILSLDVTSEQVHDGKVLPVLIEDITIKQNKNSNTVIADGSYDNNNNFQFLSFNGIKPAIKVRKNSRCRKTNHYLRNKTVKMQKNNLQQWKISVDYGQRWIIESVFSCIKRMFGEYVTAIRFKNMIKEIMLKASLYNLFQSYNYQISIKRIKIDCLNELRNKAILIIIFMFIMIIPTTAIMLTHYHY